MPVKSPDLIEKRLLEEYREQCLCWKHDDDIFSKLTAVLFPLSIAALTLPYLKAGPPKLLCVVGGLMLIAYWFFTSESIEDRSNIRWSRIHEIERFLGFDSHLRIDRERQKSVWKGVPLRRLIFIAYITIALFVTCDIKVAPVNPRVAYNLDQFICIFLTQKLKRLYVPLICGLFWVGGLLMNGLLNSLLHLKPL